MSGPPAPENTGILRIQRILLGVTAFPLALMFIQMGVMIGWSSENWLVQLASGLFFFALSAALAIAGACCFLPSPGIQRRAVRAVKIGYGIFFVSFVCILAIASWLY